MDTGGSIKITDPSVGGASENWSDEPPRFRQKDVDQLLIYAVKCKASDITLQTDRPVYLEVDGKLRPCTRRSLDSADISIFLHQLYGAEALAKLAGGRDLDLSYEVRPDRNERIRFRVNATAILSKGRDAVQVTLRVLPGIPPTMEELGIEQDIIDHWAPRQGLVLVTGATGSGKSTLLAAGNRMLIEKGCGKLLTYEAPIEYVYDAIVGERSLVSQSEIPRHLPSFSAGVRNALRRKPEIIVVGEARDRETVAASIEAGQTGHAVYATVHTTGVAATIRRMMSVFEPSERTERSYALMETVRLIVTQALVPKIGGGRVGIREWLVFDNDFRERLLGLSTDTWWKEVQDNVERQEQSIVHAARRAYEEGLIEKRWLLLFSHSMEEV